MNIELDPLDWIDTLNAIAAQQNRLQTIKANIEAQAAKQQQQPQPAQEQPNNGHNAPGSPNGSPSGGSDESSRAYCETLERASAGEVGPV